MERRFHVFVRRCAGQGYHVELIGRAELAAFAEDVDEARADLGRVLSRLLSRDSDFDRMVPPLREVRIRRVEVTLRAVQGERLLPVPVKLTAVLHAPPEEDSAPGSVVLRVPRLGVRHTLSSEADVDAFVEELARQRLFMADASKLVAIAYDGEETVESLTVSYRPNYPELDANERSPSAANARGAAPIEACRDVCAEARAATLDRAFARDDVLHTLTGVLAGRRRASVVLVGASGVGKTAIVHELAHRIVEAPEGSALRGVELWATAGSRLVAGMRYLGEWQARVQRMLDALRSRRALLYIEDLSELLASAQGDRSMDIPSYLLPSIEAGELVVLCEATSEDLSRAERSHPAFVRALRSVMVAPLEGRAARSALESVAARTARGKRVRFTDDSLVRAEDLCERFGDGTALPGASVALLRAAVNTAASSAPSEGAPPRSLSAEDVTRAFCERTGYPRALVDPAIRLDPDEVLARLRARVVGQEGALALLRDLVVTLKTGMSDPSRPLGSFLFLGPTGVGKTESALSLAHYLFGDEQRVARFDMSEYAAPASAQRLISDAAGAQGSLTRRVREQPFGVVLLDEIEKADTGVHDLLLQILGEGRLSDSAGRTVSFRNTVVVLTSNLGADTANRSLGFSAGARADLSAHYVSAAAQFFRPELLNRIDHVVPFAALSDETVLAITRRTLDAALSREGLHRRKVKVRYDDSVVSALARLGFDPRYGARPLKRAIEQWVIGPIARVLAARGPASPPEVELVVRGNGVAVAPTSTPEVSAMSAEDVFAEVERRAKRLEISSVTLVIEPVDAGAGSRARWLIERYALWCESHGADVSVAPAGRLTVRGAIAAALLVERGVHEFEAGAGIARVRVRTERERDEDDSGGVRLYTTVPEPAAWDVNTELEWVGAWDRAVEGEALDRFVLARLANG